MLPPPSNDQNHPGSRPPRSTPHAIVPADLPTGTATTTGTKRSFDQVDDTESQPSALRSRSSPETSVLANTCEVPRNNQAGYADTPIDIEGIGSDGTQLYNATAKDGLSNKLESSSERANNKTERDNVKNRVIHIDKEYTSKMVGQNHMGYGDITRPLNDKYGRAETEHLTEAERKLLFTNVVKVELMLKREKWNLVVEAMKLAGVCGYTSAFFEKEYEKITRMSTNLSNVDANSPLHELISKKMPRSSEERVPNDRSLVPSMAAPNLDASTRKAPNHVQIDHAYDGFSSFHSREKVPRASLDFYNPPESAKATLNVHAHPNKGTYKGFGVLVNQGPLEYSPQEAPANVTQRMAEQGNGIQQSSPPAPYATNNGALVPDLSAQHPTHPLSEDSTRKSLTQNSFSPVPIQLPMSGTSESSSPISPTMDQSKATAIHSLQKNVLQGNDINVGPEPEAHESFSHRTTNEIEHRAEHHNALGSGMEGPRMGVRPSSIVNAPSDSQYASKEIPISASDAASHENVPRRTSSPYRSVVVQKAVEQAIDKPEATPILAASPHTLPTEEAVSGAPVLSATQNHQGTAFIPVNGPRIEAAEIGSNDKQLMRPSEISTPVTLPSDARPAFVSVNEHYHVAPGKQERIAVKYEENDTRSRPRLANEKVAILEREFQENPMPSKEYKKGLADSLDTTYFKVNNWYSNRRSKATTQAKQLRALQETRHNSITVEPSPVDHSAAVSTPPTDATPETEPISDPKVLHQSNGPLPFKSEPVDPISMPQFGERDPVTPLRPPGSATFQEQSHPTVSPDSHEVRSAAMRAAWARRKALGRNGRDGGIPKYSPTVRTSLMGDSPSAFAAQILAAAEEAQKSASSTPTPRDSESLPSPPQSQATPDRFAQGIAFSETPSATAYSQLHRKRSSTYKKRNVSGLAPSHAYSPSSQLHSPSLSGPSSPYGFPKPDFRPSKTPDTYGKNSASPTSHPFVCEKCARRYQQAAGLKYHRNSHPNCDTSPPRTDKRTASIDGQAIRRASDAKMASVEPWPAVNTSN